LTFLLYRQLISFSVQLVVGFNFHQKMPGNQQGGALRGRNTTGPPCSVTV